MCRNLQLIFQYESLARNRAIECLEMECSMPTIFDAMSTTSEEQLCTELAIMQTVSLSGAVMQTGRKAIGRISQWANKLAGMASETVAERFDYKVIGLKDEIEALALSYGNRSRKELLMMMQEQLTAKCHELDASVDTLTMSQDALSIWIIREAAKTFGIDNHISPARAAIMICEKYEDKLLQRLHKMLQTQTPEQVKATDRQLQLQLNKVPMEVMRSLAQTVRPTEFSGMGIGKAIRLERGTEKLEFVVAAMGFTPFDELELRILAIYDSVLALNRMPRAFVAEAVWLFLKSYGRRFILPSDLLPSFNDSRDIKELKDAQRAFEIRLRERREGQGQLDRQLAEITALNDRISKLQADYLEKTKQKTSEEEAFAKLEAQKEQYIRGTTEKSAEEAKQYYAEVTRTKRELDKASESLDKAEAQLDAAGNQLIQKREIYHNAAEEFAVLRRQTDSEIAKKSLELALQWKAYFYRFTFDEVIFSQVILDFTRTEMLQIEEYMKEMHDSRDIAAYAIAEEEEQDENAGRNRIYQVVLCNVGNGKTAKIMYHETYIRKVCK